jgi:hypothetical protein
VSRPAGTASWAAGDRLIYQQDSQDAAARWEWLFLTTQTGATRGFEFPGTAYRPAISASGDFIAYDDGEAQPSVYLFDTADRTIELLAAGYVAPLWIGPNRLAMTAAGPCKSGDLCEVPWESRELTGAVDLATGKTVELALPTTLAGVGRYGLIDVHLP